MLKPALIFALLIEILVVWLILYLSVMELKADKSIKTYNPNAIYHLYPIEVNRLIKCN